MVYVFLAEGFEEIEALTVVDLLRRGDVFVQTVTVSDELVICGARGIPVTVDIAFEECDFDKCELLVFPGGMPGTLNLKNCDKLMEVLDRFISENKRVAAICAAPARIFGERGILKGKKATCYPGMEEYLEGAEPSLESVVTDGNVTTSRGLGTAIDFALELLKLIKGEEVSQSVGSSIVYL